MIDSLANLAANAATPPLAPTQGGAAPAPPSPTANDDTKGAAAKAAAPATPQSATRLLVEPDGGEGYVYRLVDSATGRLLMELPREQADQLQADPAYSAGDLVSRSV